MIIRKAEEQDYSAVDQIILKLHALHVASNPDFYEPVDHVITMADYQEFIASPEHLIMSPKKTDLSAASYSLQSRI